MGSFVSRQKCDTSDVFGFSKLAIWGTPPPQFRSAIFITSTIERIKRRVKKSNDTHSVKRAPCGVRPIHFYRYIARKVATRINGHLILRNLQDKVALVIIVSDKIQIISKMFHPMAEHLRLKDIPRVDTVLSKLP